MVSQGNMEGRKEGRKGGREKEGRPLHSLCGLWRRPMVSRGFCMFWHFLRRFVFVLGALWWLLALWLFAKLCWPEVVSAKTTVVLSGRNAKEAPPYPFAASSASPAQNYQKIFTPKDVPSKQEGPCKLGQCWIWGSSSGPRSWIYK